jgi:hypothetical protein
MDWWSDESKAKYIEKAAQIQREVDECLRLLEVVRARPEKFVAMTPSEARERLMEKRVWWEDQLFQYRLQLEVA